MESDVEEQSEGSRGDEEERDEEEEAEEEVEDKPLTKTEAGNSLSLLCKTGPGLAHAYVRMDLRDKQLSDISILNCFTHLRYLDVSGNRLLDLSPLNALPQLLSIKANNNRLTSAQLQEMKYLQYASLTGNKIKSTDGLSHPLLETLDLSSNKITELVGLDQYHLPCLKLLDLHGNQLTSVAGIMLPTLRKLYIAENRLTDLSGLGALRQLASLHARTNQIASLDGLPASMESLQYLNLRANFIAEISGVVKLNGLPLLRCIVMADCPICEIDDYRLEVLVGLPRLERLDKDEFTEDERTDAEEVAQERREAAAERDHDQSD